MIPRRLHLRNFLSYRDCTIDLAGLHLAVLCGRNGFGKSALLDAMTWALWGEARGRLEDDRIYLGEYDMLVEFEFEVEGDVYQVVRKRTRGRAAGALDLLQIAPDGRRVPLTGSTMRETQSELTRRLRMDHETFANSAFVAQGHADEFTRKNAAERKEVFRKVLGLERYEILATIANNRRREAVARLANVGRELEEMRAEAAKLPAVTDELAAVVAGLRALDEAIPPAESEVAELTHAAADYERRTRDLAERERRIEEAARAIASSEAALARFSADLEVARETLARSEEVGRRYRALVAARDREHEMATLQAQAAEKERAIETARSSIAGERIRIESGLAALRRELDAARAAIATRPALQELDARVRTEASALADLGRQIDELIAGETQFRATAAGCRADAEQYRLQAQEMKERESQLEGAAICPVCRKPLSPAESDKVRNDYAEQRRSLGVRYRDALAAADDAEGQADAARACVTALEEERSTRESARRALERDLDAGLRLVEQADAKLPALRAQAGDLEDRLASESFAPDARETLRAAEAELAAVGYDAVEHQRIRATVRDLADAEEAFRQDALAAERAAGLEAAIAREHHALEEGRAARAELDREVTAARADLAAATDVTPRLSAAAAALAALRNQVAESQATRGRLEERCAQLRALKGRLEIAADETRALKEEEQVHGELSTAFGKNGVQAMLIDQSLPRLQATANKMLDLMTGGQIQVSLHTQRTTARGAVQETLDIRISDDLGTRDYEMYSGGEAFRVDFALRIALARLLAERAGASLPTLIIDEGFGSQDQEGIDRLVEAINSIASEFRLILVVTHIDELKDRFDRRIEVTKDVARGSFATVV